MERYLGRPEDSSLIERAVAMDKLLKQLSEAAEETRRYLHDCVVDAVARGAGGG